MPLQTKASLQIQVQHEATAHCSNSTVSTPRATPLQCVDHATDPILEDIRDVTDGVAVGEEVPTTGTVAVVVEPGAENEVGGDAQEETDDVSLIQPQRVKE